MDSAADPFSAISTKRYYKHNQVCKNLNQIISEIIVMHSTLFN